jgi:VWFA-related protein
MRAPNLRSPLTLGFLLGLLGLTTAGAQEELETFGGMVEVSEVLLDVLATDGEGQVVLGLGPEDFVVEEDGEPVQVTSVDYYRTSYDIAGEPDEIPVSRYFVLFFHDQTRFRYYGNRLILQQIKAGQHCRRWLRTHRAPSDWVAVAGHDGELTIYQDFTQDGEALDEAVKRAAAGKKPLGSRAGGRDRVLALKRHLPPQEGDGKREDIHDSLGRLAVATRHIVGRKNLMFFTVGFGKENHLLHATEPDPERYPALETLLNDHNVAVYPIDLTPPGRAARHADFLEQLAEDTGGVYHEDFVGFINPMREVGQENTGYYLLSFVSARPAGEIGYQRLEVKAKNPEIVVRSRKGYRYGL